MGVNSRSPGRGAVLLAVLALACVVWLFAILPAVADFALAAGLAAAWCALLERQERRRSTGPVPDPEGGRRLAIVPSSSLDVVRARASGQSVAGDAARAA